MHDLVGRILTALVVCLLVVRGAAAFLAARTAKAGSSTTVGMLLLGGNPNRI